MKISKVISGGQNGSDQAALRAAKELGYKTGGWMPNGWITLDGPRPEFKELYDMKECYAGYKARTEANVIDSDATLLFASDFKSPGERCTFNAIRKFAKPYFKVHTTDDKLEEALAWLKWIDGQTLNVAGNSESTSPGIGEMAYLFLLELLSRHQIMIQDTTKS
jgi:hypothetical protein